MGPQFLQVIVASGAINIDIDATMLAHTILFFFFVMIMKPLIFDPLLRVFEERERRTAGAITRAREMDEEAIGLKQEYDLKLDDVRRSANADREQVRTRIRKLQADMMDASRDSAAKTIGDGMQVIKKEVDEIRHDLEKNRGQLAVEIASRVLGREVKS